MSGLLVTGLVAAGLGTSCALVTATAAAAGSHATKHHPHKIRHHHVVRQAPLHVTVTPTPAPVGSTASVAPANCSDGDLIPSAANLDQVGAATLCLVNQQRTTAGLAPLRANADLGAAATRHSEDMVAGDYFDHVAPTGLDVLDRILSAGYATVGAALSVGENIAAATGPLATPAATVASWMQSPGHRANILNPAFIDTGIGVAAAAPALLGSGPGATYTQCFGAVN